MSEIQNSSTSGVVMVEPTEKELSLAFPGVKYGGYVYIIVFDNGILKAGRTQKPAQRIANHASSAASFSARISKVWVSCPHDNYAANENELMSSIAALASKQNKREYFEGVNFSDAVVLSDRLVFAPIDLDAHEARTQKSFQKMKGFLGARFGKSEPATENPMMAWGKPIRDMFKQVQLSSEIDSSDSDPEVMRELWASSAASMGRTYDEVMAMSHLDVLEHLANTFVRTAYLDAKIWALKNERTDLTASMGERYGA